VSKFLLTLLVQIYKALLNSKIQFLFRKDFFSTFGPTGQAASRPIQPFWPTRPHRPPSSSITAPAHLFHRPSFPSSARLAHTRLWRIPENMFSSLIHTFQPRRLLSLPSLTHGPRLSALSPTLRWPTPATPPLNPAMSSLHASSGRLRALTRPAIMAPP
jgi:hypothetical protein